MGFGKNKTGQIIREDNAIALGALGAKAMVTFPAITVTEDFKLLKSEIFCILDDADIDNGAGLILGIADGELTTAEIVEALSLNGPLDRNDRLNKEQATRPVWPITGLKPGTDTHPVMRFGPENGQIVHKGKPWTFSSPEGWKFWIYNQGNTAIVTGSTARLIATHYGVWVT